jgi:intein/homing endonuclease
MPEVKTTKVKSIRKGEKVNVYDIGVQKNHNFFANNLLVSNCFQEDFMMLSQKVAGFSPGESDKMRKTLVKKSHDATAGKVTERDELRKKFIDGAMNKNGFSHEMAENIFNRIEYFAAYGFNRSLYFSEPINTYSSDGKFKEVKQIQDVEKGDFLLSRDEMTGADIIIPVIDKHDHGVLELVELELNTGEKVRCTWDHKFRTVETGEMLPLWMIQEKGLSIVVGDVEDFSPESNL